MRIDNASRFIEEVNGDKYLVFDEIFENKKLKYDGVFNGIMNKI